MKRADGDEQVPVLVIFERQPSEALGDGPFSGRPDSQEMKAFAREVQGETRSYLDTKVSNGEASDVRSFWVRNVIAVEATPGTVEALAARPDVARVVYDHKYRMQTNTTRSILTDFADDFDDFGDLAVPDGYERSATGDRAWNLEYVGADDVQERNVTGTGVNVSVVDTGIDGDHPALDGTVTKWKDFTDDNYTEPTDPVGHGTHVAGTVAGQPDAEMAVGVAPGANLFGAKVFTGSGGARTSDILDAFQWSAEQDADVITASLGISPIPDEFEGQQRVVSGSTNTTSFTVERNATGIDVTGNESFDAYKPAFVLVGVVPSRVNGTQIDQSGWNRTQVMRNLTVTVEDSSGSGTLVKRNATWLYESGEVPSDVGAYKFKPGDRTRLSSTGNWSLAVTSTSGRNVSYNYTVLPTYTSNGTGEVERFVDDLARTQGVVPVFSAGNSGTYFGNRSIGSPGTAEAAITVGASEYKQNDVTAFSSRGPVGFGQDARPGVDVIAPGDDIPSAFPEGGSIGGCDAPYCSLDGTSMAAPHVAGTAALILSADGSLGRTEVTDTITSTAQRPHAPNNAFGAGVLDTWAAVNSTVDLGSRTASTEAGVRELYAGIGNTGNNDVFRQLDPVVDTTGDAAGGPDLYATNRILNDGFGVGFDEPDTSNVTIQLFVDVDRNDATGSSGGNEYVVTVNRTYWNGAFDTSTSADVYNETSANWEPTQNVSLYIGEVTAQRIRSYGGLDFASGVNATTYDWHLTATEMGSSTSDRLPDAGQVVTPPEVPVDGIAVAWNSTAGQPTSGEPITFEFYNDSGTGEPVDTETVLTNASGVAETTLTFRHTHEHYNTEYLRITDEHGNEIVQDYDVDDVYLEGFLEDRTSGGTTTTYTSPGDVEYEVSPNQTVTVKIPLSRVVDGEYDTYNGTASLRLGSEWDDYRVLVNGTTVEDGVLTATIDLSQQRIDEEDQYGENLYVSLTDTFDPTQSFRVGDVWWDSETRTELGPDASVLTGPQETVTIDFQNAERVSFGDTPEPLNTTTRAEVTWFSDREYHALLQSLSSSTASELRGSPSSVSLSPSARREVALELQSSEGFDPDASAMETRTRTVAPTERGVGSFDVAPPEDARFGFVWAEPTTESPSGDGVAIIVEDRLDQFRRVDTTPDEETRYDLDVDTRWRSVEQNGEYLPREYINVSVSLYDYQTDSYADGETVTLYTSGGAVKTVQLDGSYEVETTVPAPDLDYRNSTYDDREQQVLGIVEGVQTAEGTAVSDEESAYGYVDVVEQESVGTRTDLDDLTYDERTETFSTNITYRNQSTYSTDNVTPETTLVRVGTPDQNYDVGRHLVVDFVRPSSNPSEFTFSADPATDEEVQYAIGARTADMRFEDEEHYWADGPTVQVDQPQTYISGAAEEVTLSVTDRNGEPIEDATVVWRSMVYASTGDYADTNLPTRFDGTSRVGHTNGSGAVTFQVEHTIPDGATERGGAYSVGVVTDNASAFRVADGSLSVTGIAGAEVTGSVDAPARAVGVYQTVSGTAENVGSETATDTTLRLELYNETSGQSTTLAQQTTDLASGESVTLDGSFERGVTNGFADNYTVRMVTDANANVSESDETNNNASQYVEGSPIVSGQVVLPDGADNVDDDTFVAESSNQNLIGTNYDSEGYYRLGLPATPEGGPEDNYTFTFYQWKDGSGNLAAPRDGVVDTYELHVQQVDHSVTLPTFEIPNGSVVDIRTVDESGDPIENATVYVTSERFDSVERSGWYNVSQTADGYYTNGQTTGLELTGPVRIAVWNERNADLTGTEPDRVRTIDVSSNRTEEFTLEQQPETSNVTAGFETPSDAAAEGLFVLHGRMGAPVNENALSSGEATVGVPSGGVYQATYRQVGGGDRYPLDGVPDVFPVQRLYADGDRNLGTSTLPQAHRLNVTVVNETGAPVPDAQVNVIIGGNRNFALYDNFTNAQGEFVAGGTLGIEVPDSTEVVNPPGAGNVQIQAFAEGVQGGTRLNVTSDTDVTVTVKPKTQVSGSVAEPDGTPANATAVVVGDDDGNAGGASTATDDSGTFSAAVPANSSYSFKLRQDVPYGSDFPEDGLADVYAATKIQVGASQYDIGTTELPVGHEFDLTVVDPTGESVEDARVTIHHVNGGVVEPVGASTLADGRMSPDVSRRVGVELNGTVMVTVTPPEGGDRFSDDPVTETYTVDSATSDTIVLEPSATDDDAAPDLTSTVDAPQRAVNTTVSVSGTAENLGNETATDATVELQYKVFAEADDTWTTVNSTAVSLAPGESVNLSGSFERRSEFGFANNYTVRTVVDPADAVAESNETNNEASQYVEGSPIVSGAINLPQGTQVNDSWLVAASDGTTKAVTVSDDGTFRIGLPAEYADRPEDDYTFTFAQRNGSTIAPRDGVVDQYDIARQQVNTSTTLPITDIPNGSVVDVRTVDENGDPVENASVRILDDSFPGGVEFLSWNQTPEGYFDVNSEEPSRPTGLEVTGDVTIQVRDERGPNFTDDVVTKERTITVTEDTTETFVLYDGEDTHNVSAGFETASGQFADGTLLLDDRMGSTANASALQEGAATVSVAGGGVYQAAFTQVDAGLPIDGVPDLYPVQRLYADSDRDLGTTTLPTAHRLNATVRYPNGSAAEDASVSVFVGTNRNFAFLNSGTDAQGRLTVGDSLGIEVPDSTEVPNPPGAGNVWVQARTPDGFGGGARLNVTSDESVTVELQPAVDVSGSVVDPSGSETQATAVIVGDDDGNAGGTFAPTDTSGVFIGTVPSNSSYSLKLRQDVPYGSGFPKDGLADVYAVKKIQVGQTGIDTGTTELPVGHEFDLTVVDSAGDPVEDARVTVHHVNGDVVEPVGASTLADGTMVPDQTRRAGLELNGTVQVTVTAPANSSRFTDERVTQTFTVDSATSETVTLPTSQQDAQDSVSVRLSPDPVYAATNGTATFDVVVENVTEGVGAYNLTVDLGSDEVATIESVDFAGSPAFNDTTFAADNSSVQLAVAGDDTANGTVTVATVTVNGSAAGTTTANLSVGAIGTEGGSNYAVADTVGTTVNVSEVEKVDAEFTGVPTDPDGDGKFEDVNGDGKFNIVDVQALFDHREDTEVSTMQFDYNNDGTVDVIDVQYLFATEGN